MGLFEKNNPIKASLWYTICSMVQKGISMILIPLYVHLMSTEEYGQYTLFQSWESIVLIFATLNLAAYAFNNCLIQHENSKDQVTGAFLGLICILTILICFIFGICLSFWEKIFHFSGKYIFCMALDSMFIVVIDLWFARKRFDYEFYGVVIVTILNSVLNLGLGSTLVFLSGEKAFAAVISKVLVQGLISIILAVDIWSKGKCFYKREIWKYALFFNIPLIPHFLSTKALQQADRVMIERICGVSEAGIYGFSYKISEAMQIFNTALLASLIPWTYHKLKEKKYNEIHEGVFPTLLLVGILNLMLIFVAPEIVAILGTDEYSVAAYIIPPVALSNYLMFLFNIFVNVTYYYEQNKLVVIASIIASGINIVLNWLFIPVFGYIAAGYTTFVSYSIFSIVHYLMYRYTLHKKYIKTPVYRIPSIVWLSIILVIIGLGCVFIYSRKMIRYVFLGVIVVSLIYKRQQIIVWLKKTKSENDL